LEIEKSPPLPCLWCGEISSDFRVGRATTLIANATVLRILHLSHLTTGSSRLGLDYRLDIVIFVHKKPFSIHCDAMSYLEFELEGKEQQSAVAGQLFQMLESDDGRVI
jgi:hypothetical protein